MLPWFLLIKNRASKWFSPATTKGYNSEVQHYGSSCGLFRLKKLVLFLCVLIMVAVAAVVLIFTIGVLRSSQSARAVGLRLDFSRIGCTVIPQNCDAQIK